MAVKSEEERALLYRDNNDAKIVFRQAQLAQLAGSRAALEALWKSYRAVYDRTNYIEGQPDEDFMSIEDFYTDGQKDYDGSTSASPIRLRHTRRANP